VTEPEEGFTTDIQVGDDTESVPLTTREERLFKTLLRSRFRNASLSEADADAQQILDSFSGQVDELTQQVIGAATEPLCLERIPGQGRSAICDDNAEAASGAQSNINGGFIQQIVTDAFAARAFRADFALQNAGGVRIDLPAGNITIADAYELLPFANTLVELELTGKEVADVLEDAVDNFLDDGGSTGSYPYGSRLRWDVDLSQPSGMRFSNVEVYDRDSGTWGPIDPDENYVVVTNSFIASGRDGYDAFGVAFNEGRVTDTFIDYAQGFIDWVEQDAGGTVSVPAPAFFSTQSFVPAAP
jgi:5'-nucleotidase